MQQTLLMTDDKERFEVHRLEVVNTGRRRRWSLSEKLRIVEESYQGYRQVSATARRHEISPSLLYSWRQAFAAGSGRSAEQRGFAAALIVPEEPRSEADRAAGGRMEVVTARGQRIIVAADVDAQALARVVAALEGR